MNLKTRLLVLLLSIFLSNNVFALESVITLDTRTDVTQQILVEQPDNPKANLILFAGGRGKIELDSGAIKMTNNFLIRSRQLFINNGFAIVVIDAPSDRQDRLGMLKGFRNSKEHIQDIEAIIDYIRSINRKPIWLIGTSRGTESAAYAAVHLNHKVNGVVLTSSISNTSNKGTSITDLELDRITVPVLAIHHKDDECWVTEPKVVQVIKNKAYNSSRVIAKTFSGGDEPISKNPCRAKTYHGYLGIEEEVIDFIGDFISKK